MLNTYLKRIFECKDVKKKSCEKKIFIEKETAINQKKHSCVNMNFDRMSKYDILESNFIMDIHFQ